MVCSKALGPGAQLGFLRKLPKCPTQIKVLRIPYSLGDLSPFPLKLSSDCMRPISTLLDSKSIDLNVHLILKKKKLSWQHVNQYLTKYLGIAALPK